MEEEITKVCKICEVEKLVNEFPLLSIKPNKYRTLCLLCYNQKRRSKKLTAEEIEQRRLYQLEYYNKDREARAKIAREWRKNNKERFKENSLRAKIKQREIYHKWKSTLKCSMCNENHPACLDFHHLDPSIKEKEISKMIHSPLKLAEEIKKCIILCSNCHKKLHYEEKN